MDSLTGRGAVVVIPTYNEAENIVRLIRELFVRYPGIAVTVVDDASPDGTGDVTARLCERYPALSLMRRPAKLGLGSAYREALSALVNQPDVRVVVTMDADFSHDPAAIGPMLARLGGTTPGLHSHVLIHCSGQGGQIDAVVGSRYVAGGSIENWPLSRRILSRFANRYARAILGLPVADLTSGFQAFRLGALRQLPWRAIRTEGYGFLIELKYRLCQSGARIVEVPITFTERRAGASKLSRRTIWEAVWLPWKLTLQKVKSKKEKVKTTQQN